MSAPAIVNAILLLVLAEAAALAVLHRAGRAPGLRTWWANLAAGFMLLLALRCGLAGAGGGAVMACLGLAGLAHMADLRIRWGVR